MNQVLLIVGLFCLLVVFILYFSIIICLERKCHKNRKGSTLKLHVNNNYYLGYYCIDSSADHLVAISTSIFVLGLLHLVLSLITFVVAIALWVAIALYVGLQDDSKLKLL